MYKDGNYKHLSGFTLVELLVVIVVLAILATISIVGYNGIQSRARTVHYQSAVNGYEKLLDLYYAENNDWPDVGYGCLGTVSDYPATSQFPAGACVANASTNAAVYSVSTGLNGSFSDFTTNPPAPPTSLVVEYGGLLYRGAYLYSYTSGYEVEFALPTNTSCPIDHNQYLLTNIHWCERDSGD